MAEEALLPPLEEIMALSTRLTDHADSIANAAAHEMETDLRKASDLLRRYVTLLANMDDECQSDAGLAQVQCNVVRRSGHLRGIEVSAQARS
jgi:hypothetical protein